MSYPDLLCPSVAADCRFETLDASQEKTSWCPVAPILTHLYDRAGLHSCCARP